MDIVVLKFGGTSVANNINLNIVAEKIIKFKKLGYNIVAVVSAQGKTTDKLIKEAKELSSNPDLRELDSLLSVGEQISASKLAILLNRLGHEAISMTGWQIGIKTTNEFQNAKIKNIDVSKIQRELQENKIVIVTGFQGVDENSNITTLGRGGSDTSAVALAIALKASKCYIFSDVDGIYTSDPGKVKNAKKISNISYEEMQSAASEGAKVLHDRCVSLANKYNLPIIAASTFNSNEGTLITRKNEKNNMLELTENKISNIVKNDNVLILKIKDIQNYNQVEIIKKVLENDIKIENCIFEKKVLKIFTTSKEENKIACILEKLKDKVEINKASKISIISKNISNQKENIYKIISKLNKEKEKIEYINFDLYKLLIQFNKKIDDDFLNELHQELIIDIIEE